MFIGGERPYGVNPYKRCMDQCYVDYSGAPAKYIEGFEGCVKECKQKETKWYNEAKNKLDISLRGCQNQCTINVNPSSESAIDQEDACKSECSDEYIKALQELDKEYRLEYKPDINARSLFNFAKRFFA